MFDRLNQVGTSIRSGLRDVVDDIGIPAQVAGAGPVYNVFFTDQPIVNHRQIMGSRMDLSRDLLLRLARERVLISSSKGWLSTAHDEDDVGRAVDAYRKCLTDMVDAGLLPTGGGDIGDRFKICPRSAERVTMPTQIDPITLSVVQGALQATQRAMTTTMEKTGRSSVYAIARGLFQCPVSTGTQG